MERSLRRQFFELAGVIVAATALLIVSLVGLVNSASTGASLTAQNHALLVRIQGLAKSEADALVARRQAQALIVHNEEELRANQVLFANALHLRIALHPLSSATRPPKNPT